MSVPWDPTERPARPGPIPPPPLAAARPRGTSDVQIEQSPSPVGRVIGGYRILSVIQRGGMGEILLGEPIDGPMKNEQVVLKRLLEDLDEDERYRGMIGAEARVTMRMDHPNIVKVFEAPMIDGKQWLSMEFIHGRNVSQILKRCRKTTQRMPPQIALTIALHVLEGLQYAHSMVLEDGASLDLVHRDVTPGNILVSFDGAVKITDFGIAKSRMSVVSTTVGVVKGTTRYLSPEQIRGQTLDGRSDIFSAATVLTEMLTGAPLFDRGAVPPTLFAIIKGERRPDADMHPCPAPLLAAALEKALAISPKNRFRDAASFADALRAGQRELGRPLPADGLGRFLQDLFNAAPARKQAASLAPVRASLDLTYLFEVNDNITRDVGREPPPATSPELEAELEQLLAGVTPLAPEEFEDAHSLVEKSVPPPVPPMSQRLELPTFPMTTSGQPSLEALAIEVTDSLHPEPPRFPPPRPGHEPVTEDLERPPSSISDASLPELERAGMGRTRRRVLFLAGILCGALLVWGATSAVARMLPSTPPASQPILVELRQPGPIAAQPSRDVDVAKTKVEPAPVVLPPGSIDVRRPRGARVTIDGTLVKKRVPIRQLELEPGRHTVLIQKRKFRRKVIVEIAPGQRLDISTTRFRELSPPVTSSGG